MNFSVNEDFCFSLSEKLTSNIREAFRKFKNSNEEIVFQKEQSSNCVDKDFKVTAAQLDPNIRWLIFPYETDFSNFFIENNGTILSISTDLECSFSTFSSVQITAENFSFNDETIDTCLKTFIKFLFCCSKTTVKRVNFGIHTSIKNFSTFERGIIITVIILGVFTLE